jgi:hypothetical protein
MKGSESLDKSHREQRIDVGHERIDEGGDDALALLALASVGAWER